MPIDPLAEDARADRPADGVVHRVAGERGERQQCRAPTGVLSAPVAHSAPVAKSSESPGRNGVTTKPVSAKTMANSTP